MSDRLKGYLVTLLGVFIITPDALLLRLIEADPWTIMVWRGLGFFAVQWLIVTWRYGRDSWAKLRATGKTGLLVALTMSIGQILFVYSIHNTLVANTLVIIAGIPLATAALAWLWLGERIDARMLLFGGLAVAAVAMTMAGGLAVGGTKGDLAAIGAVLCLAVLFTGLRRAQDVDMLPAISISGLVSATIAFLVADNVQPVAADIGYLLVLCLFVSPVSFALITIGPRYLPAPEVALLLLLETALGPFWVWLVLGEKPTWLTLLGGLVMIATLAANSWLLLRAPGRE